MNSDCILEDFIIQGEEMAVFHPQSINTCRFVSYIGNDGEAHPLFSTIRTGVGDSIVDNVGSGGITALVDIDTGIICTDGMRGINWYEKHPDSGVVFKGYQLPDWNELRAFIKSAHETRPQQKLLGWDMAWTVNNGWDVVEINPAPAFSSYQRLTGKGIRKYISSIGLYD
ncbi:MAG: sugar-transfer associated ATP-grasp domain-containing protein [Clostridia bacterium]|nr:sugar-transfer associated ATP-grasp domain-containing protein [Clostridia bacterium]